MNDDDYIDQVLDEALDLLYGSPDEQIKGVNLLHKDPSILDDVAENHQLLSALARLFGENSQQPLDLTFALGKLFLSLSLIEDNHQALSTHRVGALAMGVVELELKRAQHRGADSVSDEVASTENYTFTTKQEHVVFLCLSLLDNLADDITILRKMMKKSLVAILLECLNAHQPASEYITATLSLLKKASVFEETADELSSDGCKAISQLARLLVGISQENTAVQLTTLFNLSFHEDCSTLISKEKIHPRLVTFLQNPALCTQTLQLIYHLSSRAEDRQLLFEAGITSYMIDFLTYFSAKDELDMTLAGLLVNMTLHPLCSEEMIHLGAIDSIFRIVQKSQDDETKQILLKVTRRLSDWTKRVQCRLANALEDQDVTHLSGLTKDPAFYTTNRTNEENDVQEHTPLYWEKHFWDAHVEFIIKRTLDCKNDDLLVEWLGILNNLTCDDLPAGLQWYDILDDNQYGIVELFQRLLDSACHGDIKLELIIWLGELCTSKECSHWIASNNLIDFIHRVFLEQQDAEMRLQIIQTYERCLVYDVTRFQVLGGDGVLNVILDCLSGESSLRNAAERCLTMIEDFDRDEAGKPGEIGSDIREQRYEELMHGTIRQIEKALCLT